MRSGSFTQPESHLLCRRQGHQRDGPTEKYEKYLKTAKQLLGIRFLFGFELLKSKSQNIQCSLKCLFKFLLPLVCAKEVV